VIPAGTVNEPSTSTTSYDPEAEAVTLSPAGTAYVVASAATGKNAASEIAVVHTRYFIFDSLFERSVFRDVLSVWRS
jgi:hypothetical protein